MDVDPLKYTQLIGNAPFFDNLRFCDQTNTEDLFLHDQNVERSQELEIVTKSVIGP